MSITNEIKKYVLGKCDCDVVGIADIKYLMNEKDGYRPTEILPNAKSIVVFGKAMTDGSISGAFRTFEDKNPFAYSTYGAFSADLASNFSLFFDTFNITQFIERNFHAVTVPLPCGPMQNGTPNGTAVPEMAGPDKRGLPFDIEKAAVAAGLGHYGWSGRILTEEYGPRIQFGAVITALELDYDKPYDGPNLCDPEKCNICVNMCPTHAIPAKGEKPAAKKEIVGRCDEVADHNFNACVVAACAMRKEFGGMGDYIDTTNPTDEELAQAFKTMPINHWDGLDHFPKWRCDKCLLYCPVGHWKEKFSDTGLSNK